MASVTITLSEQVFGSSWLQLQYGFFIDYIYILYILFYGLQRDIEPTSPWWWGEHPTKNPHDIMIDSWTLWQGQDKENHRIYVFIKCLGAVIQTGHSLPLNWLQTCTWTMLQGHTLTNPKDGSNEETSSWPLSSTSILSLYCCLAEVWLI